MSNPLGQPQPPHDGNAAEPLFAPQADENRWASQARGLRKRSDYGLSAGRAGFGFVRFRRFLEGFK